MRHGKQWKQKTEQSTSWRRHWNNSVLCQPTSFSSASSGFVEVAHVFLFFFLFPLSWFWNLWESLIAPSGVRRGSENSNDPDPSGSILFWHEPISSHGPTSNSVSWFWLQHVDSWSWTKSSGQGGPDRQPGENHTELFGCLNFYKVGTGRPWPAWSTSWFHRKVSRSLQFWWSGIEAEFQEEAEAPSWYYWLLTGHSKDSLQCIWSLGALGEGAP